jgi:hypothetical protein
MPGRPAKSPHSFAQQKAPPAGGIQAPRGHPGLAHHPTDYPIVFIAFFTFPKPHLRCRELKMTPVSIFFLKRLQFSEKAQYIPAPGDIA